MNSLIKKNWLDLGISEDKTHRQFCTRFAPSPTGYLHFGHVIHLIYLWALSYRFKAQIQLRCEDHDQQRSRPEFLEAIIQDLHWLGFIPDQHVGLSDPNFVCQSSDPRPYKQAIAKLQSQGLCYSCDCSRPQILGRLTASHAQLDELYYDSYCRQRGLPFEAGKTSLRLRVDKDYEGVFSDIWLGKLSQRPASQCGDFILVDKRGNFSYQLASVVDDARSGINLIVRGLDILESTGRQLYLRQCLGLPTDLTYAHHPLLFAQDSSEKLSKRQKSASIRQLREEGANQEEVLAKALILAGIAKQDLRQITLKVVLENAYKASRTS